MELERASSDNQQASSRLIVCNCLRRDEHTHTREPGRHFACLRLLFLRRYDFEYE